jgi:hypothetical protein
MQVSRLRNVCQVQVSAPRPRWRPHPAPGRASPDHRHSTPAEHGQPRRAAARPAPAPPPAPDAAVPAPARRPVQNPPRRRGRGHRPEQRWLVTQHRQIRDRLSAVGEHHHHIDQHPARVVTRTTTPRPDQRRGHRRRQPGRVGQIGQQPRSCVGGNTLPVGGHHDLPTNRSSLHLRSSSLRGRSERRQLRSNRPEQALSHSTARIGSTRSDHYCNIRANLPPPIC